MRTHKRCKIVKVDYGTIGELPPYIFEIWVTLDLDGKSIEAFLSNEEVVSDKDPQQLIGLSYDFHLIMLAYDLERVNIKKKLFRQIETFPKDPIYILVAPVKKITGKDNGRIIVDVGFDLEVDITGKKHDWVRERLKEGDWVFVKGKMFSEIINGKEGKSDRKEWAEESKGLSEDREEGQKEAVKKEEGLFKRIGGRLFGKR